MSYLATEHTESASPVDDWPDRCRHWLDQHIAGQPQRKRRERENRPLILTGEGLAVRVDKGCLLIKDGHTHYPSPKRAWRFFPGGLDLPPRIVLVDGSGQVTLDALDWLSDQSIPLIRLRWDGELGATMSANGYAADPEKVAWQLRARDCERTRHEFAQPLTRQKLLATKDTLEALVPASADRDKAIEVVKGSLAFIDAGNAETVSDLLGQEGKVALSYWRAWRSLDLKWVSEAKHPIPEEWRTFTTRSSLHARPSAPNRRASHPVNAMLNYAYAMLITQKKIEAIADGYDPMIGVVHNQRGPKKENTASFALDLMEPKRPVVDRAILQLITEETFSGADFQLQSDGVVRLNPELARVLLLFDR